MWGLMWLVVRPLLLTVFWPTAVPVAFREAKPFASGPASLPVVRGARLGKLGPAGPMARPVAVATPAIPQNMVGLWPTFA